MSGSDETGVSVVLHPEFLDDRGHRHLVAASEGQRLGHLMLVEEPERLVAVTGADVGALRLAQWQALLLAVVRLAGAERRPRIVLPVGTPLLLRYAARSAGFAGPLRGELHRDLPERRDFQPATAAASSLEDRFLADLSSFLTGMSAVAARRHAGRLRSALRTASSGVVGTIHLTVNDASGAKPLSVAVPLNDDVMAEGVAMAIDTAMAVRRRFHPVVDGVRVFFDQSMHGLRTGEISGLAEAYVRDVHLNPAFALASELELFERQREERGANPQPGKPPRRPPLTALPPFTRIDSVTAHEFWHQIEFGFESARYRDSIEFRRAVGGYFGVDTLEHVIRGGAENSPAEWQCARARLAGEVSEYATTNPREASAELFTQWWCTAAAPPPPAQFFGQVMERFFPHNGRGA